LDTAHAFESGIIREYGAPEIKRFIDEWDKAVGLGNIVAIHANDSKTPWNSHNDRHENIGAGHIGLQGFRVLAKEKRLWDKAWLLEVPGFKNEGPDKKNVDILKKCF
jgi:endonuclease IV